ncbi:MAG TPA: hypothetical protein VJI13_01230 [Candidatus Norongarragalinales archaeon]|nr:hypothetical protein [Candidatus Norongarragalinales archaeon]
MNLLSIIGPSREKAFFFILVMIGANFPFVGTYHTEIGYTNCLQDRLLKDCENVYERTLHLNPIFWFPYIGITGSGVLAKSTIPTEEWRVPFLEFQPSPNFPALALVFLFWYLAACIMAAPVEQPTKKTD